jgi:hypothetical protein
MKTARIGYIGVLTTCLHALIANVMNWRGLILYVSDVSQLHAVAKAIAEIKKIAEENGITVEIK